MLKFSENLAKLKKILALPLRREVDEILDQEWRTDEDDTEDVRPIDLEDHYER